MKHFRTTKELNQMIINLTHELKTYAEVMDNSPYYLVKYYETIDTIQGLIKEINEIKVETYGDLKI